MYPYYGHMWGLGLLDGLFMILFWLLFIGVIVWLVRGGRMTRHMRHMWRHPDHQPSAFEILKIRYAKGEINKEEFEAKAKDLAMADIVRNK